MLVALDGDKAVLKQSEHSASVEVAGSLTRGLVSSVCSLIRWKVCVCVCVCVCDSILQINGIYVCLPQSLTKFLDQIIGI